MADNNELIRLPQRLVIGGDALHVEISAASILAKAYRDRLMGTLDAKYPGYGLGRHAGYGPAQHRAAIRELGPSRIHRVTFRGVKEYVPGYHGTCFEEAPGSAPVPAP